MTRAGSADSGTTDLQFVGGGAVPTSALHIRTIPWQVGRQFIRQHHYLHHAPPVGMVAFGVFDSDQPLARLIGALLYNNPSARMEDLTGETMELRRMFVMDCTTKNAESRCLAYTAKWLAKHYPVKRLIAYADPSRGHQGTIYKAAGWRYVGETSGSGGATSLATVRPNHTLAPAAPKLKYERQIA